MSEHEDDQVEDVGTLADDSCLEVEIGRGFARDDRAMIRTLGTLIEATAKAKEDETSPRVAYAMNDMVIAACERIARICRADAVLREDFPDCEDAHG